MLNTKICENYNANDVINSNDLRKRILNIDSRFRSSPLDPSTDFTFKLEHPYKNLIKLRVASVEIPNMFYTFSSSKRNTSFIVKAYDFNGIPHSFTITIPDGNYTSDELIDVIQSTFDNIIKPKGIYLTISLDTITAKITITHNGVSTTPITPTSTPTASAKPFILDFGTIRNRSQDFGLGFNLGYRLPQYKVNNSFINTSTGFTNYSLISEGCLDVVGFTYMFLAINDYYTVEQKTTDNYLQILAKIIIREDKQAVIYDDGGTLLSNEIIFPSPTDLKILQVKLLDPYGDIIHLCHMNFSFSLEITEVLNTKLYDFYRNYIWLGTIPTVSYKKVQGSPQSLLKGIGPPF